MPLSYRYVHAATEATTGYYTCEPPETLELEARLALLEASPNDTFLHRAVLEAIRRSVPADLHKRLTSPSAVRAALAAEALLLAGEALPADTDLIELSSATPLQILARHSQEKLSVDNHTWMKLYQRNIETGHPLPHPAELPPLPAQKPAPTAFETTQNAPSLPEWFARYPQPDRRWERPSATDTALRALMNLTDSGIIAGQELRHEASLSPVGLLRHWNVSLTVDQPGLSYTLAGDGITWGRGLSIAQARASYAMEMIERASAYLSVDTLGITDRLHPLPLHCARWSDLPADSALHPQAFPLLAPYRNQALWWVPAQTPEGTPRLVPVQAVGLFCNLDEPEILASPGSTGLASGNTHSEAKLSALLEIFERDAEATTLRTRNQCFILDLSATPENPLAVLLATYQKQGIQPWFRDITSPKFGIPCYQACVTRSDGSLAMATGAGLASLGALTTALTEVPYPYPHGPESAPAPTGLSTRTLEDFPDFRLASAADSLSMLEELLTEHGTPPLYVDLTRDDLEYPVVRAIIPGMTPAIDLDAPLPPPRWLSGL